MKLAIVRQKYRADGGAERFISRALEGLNSEDLDVTIITREWNDGGQHQSLICNPSKGLSRVSREQNFSHAVQSLLSQHHFDLVQSHERVPGCSIYRAGDGVHAEWLGQRRRILSPLKRGLQSISSYHRFVCRNEREMFEDPRLQAVICNSDMVRKEIRARFAIDPKKLHLIYNGVNTEDFTPALKETHRATQRAKLGIREQDTVAIYVGSGFERKGLKGAIHAIAKGSSCAQLLVVGTDKNIKHYQAYAKQLDAAERVHWLGVQQDVKPWYAAADLLLLPTLYDPFPNVVFEAMACGLAIITSTKCGGAELTDNNGLVRDALDYTGLSDAVKQLDDIETCARLGQRSREKAEAMDAKDMVKNLINLYQQLI